ncbi:MAG: cellulase family glycosylhydrolase [Thermoguttaceae bacterium]|nr:cellulase family glycosylhydrolase [Thermoguttaceae bacterium]MDW8039455.1 cellulase family glycosylhydrolase [Thermoguttaceae bacterium]
MKKRSVLTLMSIFLFTGTGLLSPAAEQPPVRLPVELPEPVIPECLGVNIHFTDPRPGEIEMLAEAGFRWIRMDLSWAATEPRKGQYDFSAYDRLMEVLQKHQLRALLILDYHNRFYDQGLSPYTEEGRQAMARWAAAATQRYQGRGILWEMYNEPNIPQFWKPKPNPEHYILLAKAVGKAIRQVAPKELYIGPATSQIDMKFLEACFQGGLLEYWDAVSVHPYRQSPPETVRPEYTKLRTLINKYAPPGKKIPILSGEWGYSAVWKNFNEDKQGKYLARQFLINLLSEVHLSIWYDWHDDGPDPNEPEHHFGTVRHRYFQGRQPVYDPKPAYWAAKTLSSQLKGFRLAQPICLDSQEDYLLQFQRGKESRWVAWTLAHQPKERQLPLPEGKYALFSHTGQPMGSQTAGPKGMVLTLTDAPQYIIPLSRDNKTTH